MHMDSNDTSLNDIIKAARTKFERRFEEATKPLQEVSSQFSLGHITRSSQALRARLTAENFRLMVVGRFKVGKSTFLNALLSSTGATGAMKNKGLLPVDTLPCTAVLTKISYAAEPVVVARLFDGRVEPWTFDDYLDQARIYSETASPDGTIKEGSRLTTVKSFEIGLPVGLLRSGLELVDSPGLSEDPARTEITRDALSETDAGLFVFRSDMMAGLDEQAALIEVLDKTGYVFPVVNLFHDDQVARLRNALNGRLAGLRQEPAAEKLDSEIAFINAADAFEGYARGDAERVASSGIVAMEQRLGRFLVESAYPSKQRAAIDGAKAICRVLDDDLTKIFNVASADSASVTAILDQCDSDMREIKERRDRVQDILDRMIDRAVSDTRSSYQAMCRELDISLPGRFAERPLPSLSGAANRAAALVTQRAQKEAHEAVNAIINEQLTRWGNAPPTESGLQRDLMPGLEGARRELDREYSGITERLNSMSLEIARVNPDAAGGAPAVSLQDRLVSAGLGVVALGPLGAVFAVTGIRGVAGAAIALTATKAALLVAASTFGIVLAGPAVLAVGLTALLSGAAAGGLYRLEQRIREKALEGARRMVHDMAFEGKAIEEITQSIAVSLRQTKEAVMSGLDAVLGEQQKSLENLRIMNRGTLDAKELLAANAVAGRRRIEEVLAMLTALETEAKRVPVMAAA
jgi:hypothetical protein